MLKINLKKSDLPYDKFAKESDYDFLLKEEADVYLDGKLLMAYRFKDFSKLFSSLKDMAFNVSTRSGGLVTNSLIFGSAPRISLRNDYCRSCKNNFNYKSQFNLLKKELKELENFYKETNSDVYLSHKREVHGNVLEEYFFDKKSVFTQCIVNKNNVLAYHKDQGNFDGYWSVQITMKDKNLDGGYLVFPDYRFAVECKNNSFLFFYNTKEIHGVTPIKTVGGNRITVVFYSIKNMKNCLSVDKEINRINNIKTQRCLKKI